MMLFKIAWRNIWRSRIRSVVVIGAIMVGVWSVIFLISFSTGSVKSYINNSIRNELSHLQIHHPEYPKDRDVQYVLPHADETFRDISGRAEVQAACRRSVAFGMISSSKGARGVRIKGIEPDEESAVTHIDTKLVEGQYLDGAMKNPLLISERIAERLHVKLRSKLVLTFQDLKGDITAGAFRVAGIYDTGNNVVDELNVFVRRQDLNRLLGDSTISHEIAVFLHNPDQVNTTFEYLRATQPDLLTRTYKELSPEVELFESQIAVSATIFTIIVMLALIFGIINTMLMAVLERYRELGMLMAIGMNKVKIFLMIMIETILLGLVSAPLGLGLGYLTVRWLSKTGINLSIYSEGMQEFGMSQIVYPDLHPQFYWQLAIAVAATAILASIYPALKAIRLKPVEAIRKI